jgi:hypothetical protein
LPLVRRQWRGGRPVLHLGVCQLVYRPRAKVKYGLPWQIVPRRLPELLSDPDAAKAKRVMEAMMQMVKIDVATLEAAAAAST